MDARGLGLMSRVDGTAPLCFWIDQNEVTVENFNQWQSSVSSDAVAWDPTWCAWKRERSDPQSDPNDACRAQFPRFDVQPFAPGKPMSCVDFCEAEAYCRWAGKHLCHAGDIYGVQGPRGEPQESLLACSNSLATRYPWGDAEDDRCNTGQTEESCITTFGVCGALPVGAKRGCTTASGIADLLGNVAEWVFSCNLILTDEGRAPTGCQIRGGGYDSPLKDCTWQVTMPNDTRLPSVGFRCCADLSPEERLVVNQPARE
jgi:formylglycine-generating enzyme required for sulfatase activity